MNKLLIICTLLLVSFTAYSQEDNSDKLAIVWTSDDPMLAKTMVLMYAHNAKRQKWFDEVYLVIWGPSAKMVAENTEIQDMLSLAQKDGVVVQACVSCANMYGVSEKLRELGYEVKGMGVPLTNYLKNNYKVLTF